MPQPIDLLNQTCTLNDILALKKAFFYGVHGCGMLALAQWFLDQNIEVYGYDDRGGPSVDHRIHMLSTLSLEKIDFVCMTTALQDQHPFFLILNDFKGIVFERPALLQLITKNFFSIGITGTHGKTTTTALTSFVLEQLKYQHHAFIGGCSLNDQKYSTYHPQAKVVIFEADESTPTLASYTPSIAVVLNAHADHLEHFNGEVDVYRENICQFALSAPFLVIDQQTFDHLGLALRSPLSQKIIVINDSIIQLPDGSSFSTDQHVSDLPITLQTPMSWQHRAAVLGVVFFLKQNMEKAAQSMIHYPGVGYRLEHLPAKHNYIWRDYGHHPHELLNVYKTLKRAYPNLKKIIVFQPHKYSRTKLFFKGFVEVLKQYDHVYLLPTHAAGESHDPQADTHALQSALPNSQLIEVLPTTFSPEITQDSLILFQGAGTIMSLALAWSKEH